MLGSTTASGRPGARDDAPGRVAFHSKHSVGVPGVVFSRLNTQPMRTPVNACRHPRSNARRPMRRRAAAQRVPSGPPQDDRHQRGRGRKGSPATSA
jgi:hypothetical protein